MPDHTTDELLGALQAFRETRTPCVVVTVAGYKGSTPRKPGAKMLVLEGGRTIGTIGGGALEHTMIDAALERMNGAPELIEAHLTHELGMCCGGGVTIFMEPQRYDPKLLVFGAGHVARPLARIASLAGFEVWVVDDRKDQLTEERFPAPTNRIMEQPLDVVDELTYRAADTYVVVVTHDHALDEDITAAVLKKPWRYLGVIGSHRKREMFRKRLAARGFDDALIAQIRTPVGLDIEAETPGEIAVSIVAELVAVRRNAK